MHLIPHGTAEATPGCGCARAHRGDLTSMRREAMTKGRSTTRNAVFRSAVLNSNVAFGARHAATAASARYESSTGPGRRRAHRLANASKLTRETRVTTPTMRASPPRPSRRVLLQPASGRPSALSPLVNHAPRWTLVYVHQRSAGITAVANSAALRRRCCTSSHTTTAIETASSGSLDRGRSARQIQAGALRPPNVGRYCYDHQRGCQRLAEVVRCRGGEPDVEGDEQSFPAARAAADSERRSGGCRDEQGHQPERCERRRRRPRPAGAEEPAKPAEEWVAVPVRGLVESTVDPAKRQRVDGDSPVELAVVRAGMNRMEPGIENPSRRAQLRLRIDTRQRGQAPVGRAERREHRNGGDAHREQAACDSRTRERSPRAARRRHPAQDYGRAQRQHGCGDPAKEGM
jgi:hypothetical protein